MNIEHFILLGMILFAIGVAVVITKRNAIMVLIGIELILNAANVNLVAFSQQDPTYLNGQLFALIVIVVAAAETAIALAIIINVYRKFKTTDVDQINLLKG